MRHSLRYYRHSGSVIYISKLPAPSVSMPCNYRILQSPTKGQVLLVLLETVGQSLFYTPLQHTRGIKKQLPLYGNCPLIVYYLRTNVRPQTGLRTSGHSQRNNASPSLYTSSSLYALRPFLEHIRYNAYYRYRNSPIH